MYTLTDKSQFQAQAIMQGKHKLAPVHLEIMNWITKEFGVSALDFSCEKRETSKGAAQQLIHVILRSVEDVKKMQASQAGNSAIIEQFLKHFKSGNADIHPQDPLKSNVFPAETKAFPEIIVTYRPLKKLDSEVLKEMLDDEKRAILDTFESVWTRSQGVVFYYTDVQVKENSTNGTSTRISEELAQADKKYEFNGSDLYRFDSKEAFDRDYSSNWYYYWK